MLQGGNLGYRINRQVRNFLLFDMMNYGKMFDASYSDSLHDGTVQSK